MTASEFAINLMTITMLISFISIVFLVLKMIQYRKEINTVQEEIDEILDLLEDK